jgi:hypothetical protein
MKQYRVTYKADTGEEDCVLDPNDPIHKIRESQFLGTVPGVDAYVIYPEEDGTDSAKNPYSQA